MSTVEPREHEEGGTKYSRVQCEPKISVGVIVLVGLNTKESQTQKNRKAQPGDQLLAVTLIDAMVRNSYRNARCQQQRRIDTLRV